MSLESAELSHEDFEALAAEYVLMALDPEEQRTFEEHLAECADCARLVSQFGGVAHALPLLAESQEPPAGLKQRILGAVGVQMAVADEHPAVTPQSIREGWRLTPWRAALAASMAVLLIAVSGLGVWTSRLQTTIDRNEALETRTAQAISIMGQAQQRWPVQTTGLAPEAAGSLAYAEEHEAACLVIWGLPPADEKRYAAWTIKDGVATDPRPLWTMDSGMWVLIPEEIDKMDTIAITLEGPGEMAGPHGPMVATVSLGP